MRTGRHSTSSVADGKYDRFLYWSTVWFYHAELVGRFKRGVRVASLNFVCEKWLFAAGEICLIMTDDFLHDWGRNNSRLDGFRRVHIIMYLDWTTVAQVVES